METSDDESSSASLLGPEMPKEIAQMIAAGTSPRDILALCQADRKLNRQVCKNPAFYSMLRQRDFPTWNYPLMPEEILPMELTRRNDKWLDGLPVYFGTPSRKLTRKQGRPLAKARLPGSGNTVKIHDRDYIFYYFMWAPRDHKWVNYNKKFTDEEILQDIRNKEKVFRPGALGLSFKRKHLILNRMGILDRYLSHEVLPRLSQLNLDSQEKMEAEEIKSSLFNAFSENPGYIGSYISQLLQPRTLKDLSLAYDFQPDFAPFSLAYLAVLAARDNETNPKTEYEKLLKRYNILEQLAGLEKKIPELEEDEADDLKWGLFRVFRDVNEPGMFPETEILWPSKLETILRRMATTLEVEGV